MKTSRRNVVRSVSICQVLALSLVLVLFGGCSGGGFGESVSIPQMRRTSLDPALKPGQRLILPEAKPFNVADAQRHSTGGASAESTATDRGTASCRANAQTPGEAWAEFQVGHVIYTNQKQPLKIAITFDCAFETVVETTDSQAPAKESVALKVYIQDSNRKMLHKVMLVEQNDTLGARQRTGREAHAFNVTLEPGLAYHLILAGRVEAAQEKDTPPIATSINIKKLTIEIAPQ